MTTPDFLIVNGDVVTMDPERRILIGGAVAVAGDRILEVGSTSALKAKWPQAVTIDARGGTVTPGLINAHQHITIGTFFKAAWADVPTPGVPRNMAVTLTAAFEPDDEELSSLLTAAESALNGVTMLVEPGSCAFPDRLAKGVTQVGVRAVAGTWGLSVRERKFSGPADEVLARQAAVIDAYPPGSGLVTGWVTLVGHGTADDDLMAGAADLARRKGVGLTLHMSPAKADSEIFAERSGKRPIQHMHDLGMLGPHLLIGHGVWLDDSEVELVLQTRSAIAYCPWAYLRLSQGVTHAGRHAGMFMRGGRIALGTDAANAGDQLDILRAGALAAGLSKDMSLGKGLFGAHEALEMATIRGAEAIGMADVIGSLEPGKFADIVIHDADAVTWTPKGDIPTQLIWGNDGRAVRDVFVAGKPVVRDRACVNVDVASLAAISVERRSAVLARIGMSGELHHHWPHLAAH